MSDKKKFVFGRSPTKVSLLLLFYSRPSGDEALPYSSCESRLFIEIRRRSKEGTGSLIIEPTMLTL